MVHADGYAVQLMEPPAARCPLRLDDAATDNEQMITYSMRHRTTDHTGTSVGRNTIGHSGCTDGPFAHGNIANK